MARRGGNRVRIIGGRHRGRLLDFPGIPGLRPTGDRIRETLFNWLAPMIAGGRCLDLFSGSGALGFEAASRGADRVVMLERSTEACRRLRANATRLGVSNVQVEQADSLDWLARPASERFDIAFVDPPFGAAFHAEACRLLEQNGWLDEAARIYLEYPAGEAPELPENWAILKQKRAGQVAYALAGRGD